MIITADHGNAEKMVDENGGPHTAHTTERAPLILVDAARKGKRLRPGILADIAPTMLEILGIPQPPEMTGKSLIEKWKPAACPKGGPILAFSMNAEPGRKGQPILIS